MDGAHPTVASLLKLTTTARGLSADGYEGFPPMVDPIGLLTFAYDDPLLYFVLTFVFGLAVAVILPIPLELALLPPLLGHRWGYLPGIALATAAGKTMGAWMVFLLGMDLEHCIRAWSRRLPLADWFVRKTDAFIRRTGCVGLYAILSVPLMAYKIPLYLYAIFNEGGKALERRMFVVSNFLAAINRVAIFALLFLIGLAFLSRL